MTNRRLELAFAALFISLYPAIPVAVARYAVVETPQCERPQQHTTTRRLAVFVIDSLGADEATDGRHYRRIHARFAGRPQGVVRECVDAVVNRRGSLAVPFRGRFGRRKTEVWSDCWRFVYTAGQLISDMP